MIDPESKELSLPGGTAPGEIQRFSAEFVRPGEGRFGHDKNVAFREASHAQVRYLKDGAWVQETVLLSSAVALAEQAERDGQAQAARAADAAAREAEIVARVKDKLEHLTCPICGTGQFDERTAYEQGSWSNSNIKMKLLICRRCRYVLQFAQKGFFD